MKKNEYVELYIADNGNDGEGIGRADTGEMAGMTVFVNNTVAGDRILAKLMKVKKNYAYARLEKIIEPSPYRISPVCNISDKCGGCQLQHMDYERQLEFKQKKVIDCLERIGGVNLKDKTIPVIGMDNPCFYRNKAQYPVGRGKDGKINIGFYAGRTHSIIDTGECYIQHPVNMPIIKAVRGFLEKYEQSVSIYDEQTGAGLVRHILTRVGFATGEVMVCIVINGDVLPHAEALVESLKTAVDSFNKKSDISDSDAGQNVEEVIKLKNKADNTTFDRNFTLNGTCVSTLPRGGGADCLLKYSENKNYILKSVMLNINTEKTNVILGTKLRKLYGADCIYDYIGDIKYRISPLSFYQVNPVQTKRLYDKALEFAGLTGRETVWDLYCGIGTISLFLARSARQVYGVEIIPQAIADARKNAEENNINNVSFFVGAAEEVLPQKYSENPDMHADVIVVDPPRKGCNAKLLDTIIKLRPEKMVYVSCDPATLARDVKILGTGGYVVERVQVVDQFAWTGHVECVCLMARIEK